MVTQTYDFIKTGGPLAILILFIFLILFGLQKEWMVPGAFYRELKGRFERVEGRNDVYEEHFRGITALLEKFREGLERMERLQIEQNKAVLDRLDRMTTEQRDAATKLATEQRDAATKLAEERRTADRETNELLRDIVRALNGGLGGVVQRPARPRGT